jgi:hypothetical protein
VNESTPLTRGFLSDDARDDPLRGAALDGGPGDVVDARFLAAVHLAGHAVASEACGRQYPGLRLEPRAEGRAFEMGCAFHVDGAVGGEAGGGGPARNGLEAAIITSLAGAEAERLAGGAAVSRCIDVTRWLTDGDPREAEPYVEWLRLKAERTVEHPLRQRVIIAIARALLAQGVLDAPEVEILAVEETGRYMRGQ